MKIKTKIVVQTTHNFDVVGGTQNEIILNSKKLTNDTNFTFLYSSIIDEDILNKQAVIRQLIKTIEPLLKGNELPLINLKGFKWNIHVSKSNIILNKISFIRNKVEIVGIEDLPFKHYDNVIKMLLKYIESLV